MLAEGEQIGSLICLSTIVLLPRDKEAITYFTQVETNTAKAIEQLWYRRLGHIGHTNLHQLVNMASRIKIEASMILNTCETCLISKQTRIPSQQQPTQVTTEHLELVHSDVCGPITPTSQGGARYFVTFIDDYTHHLWLYPIKEKSQAFPYFKDFRRAVELASRCKVKHLQSDGGGEYANNVFKAYLHSIGIR
jgi:GAG-pre-integrase domain/Integrase core domain